MFFACPDKRKRRDSSLVTKGYIWGGATVAGFISRFVRAMSGIDCGKSSFWFA
ncbi:hypothetical protein THOG05_20163 [Vibrio rotiferianus]|nr:hypothetical protein THOG05_20163 [Vibrio rotiferianus]